MIQIEFGSNVEELVPILCSPIRSFGRSALAWAGVFSARGRPRRPARDRERFLVDMIY